MYVQDYMGPTISSTPLPYTKIAYIFSLRKIFLLAHQRPHFIVFRCLKKKIVNFNFVTSVYYFSQDFSVVDGI